MVYPAEVWIGGGHERHAAVAARVRVVHVPVNEALEVADRAQIKRPLPADHQPRLALVLRVEDHVTEHHHRLVRIDERQIGANPVRKSVFGVARLEIPPLGHRHDEEMDAARVERISARPEQLLERLFAVIARDAIVIAQTVENGQSHVGRVHQLRVSLHPLQIADVAGMDDERAPLHVRNLARFGYPLPVLRAVPADLRISNLHKATATPRRTGSRPLKREIVCGR